MAKVFVNGELLSVEDAMISTFDHGLVVGDGAFETLLIHHRRPFGLQRHLARLNRSLSGLKLNNVDSNQIAENVREIISTCEFSEGRLRITVTAGKGPLGSARYDSPLSVVIAATEATDTHEFAQVQTVPWPRNERGALAGLKTISYAENAVALAYANERDADEAIFANTVGNLCEGSGSNVFVVVGDELFTPPLDAGCLSGITRGLVLANSTATERDISATDFHPTCVSEAFLTSAIRGVQPISMVDGTPFGEVPGPQTLAVAQRFHKLREENAEP